MHCHRNSDHGVEKMLAQVEKALGDEPAEAEAFVQACEELPEMGELTDELGGHVGWVSTLPEQDVA